MEKSTNTPRSSSSVQPFAHFFKQPDMFWPGVMTDQWAVAEAVALVDARQRELDDRRFGGVRLDAATLSLFDD